MVEDLNLLGTVGDLYCFSNALSVLVQYRFVELRHLNCTIFFNYFVCKCKGRSVKDAMASQCFVPS